MVAVPKEEAYCRQSDAYCYEWKVDDEPSLRLVATGYEDGGGFYFCRRSPKGDYRLLFAVYPAMEDARYPGLNFWGYPWDINDVVLSRKGSAMQIRVAFGHAPSDEDRWVPPTQRLVPYVLFRGVTTQPDIKVGERLHFTNASVETIQRKAMAGHSSQPTACGG
jgi:hypothetical protein